MADMNYLSDGTNTYNVADAQARADISDIGNYIGYTDDDIYGLEVDYENGTFTRLAGSIGKTGGADFNNTIAWGGRRRCNLTDDGVVTAYYGDEAYTETGALTQAVTVNGTEYPIGTAVQVMVEQPKFYYKVVPLKLESYTTQNGDIGYHIRKAAYYIADTPKDGFKLHPAFIRAGAEKEKIYLSAYEGCLYDVSESSYITDDAQVADFNADKMSSIANVKPMSGLTQNLTRANARKLAQNRGVGWEQMYIHTVSASQLLFIIEYATFNSQAAIGNGIVNKAVGSGNESDNTGGTSSLGNASGSVANGEVSYRGEENNWGNIWKWEDGINIQNPNPFNDGEYGNVYVADNGFADNTNTLPYEDTDIYPCKTGGGWISAFGYNEKFNWIFIPTEVKGNLPPVGDMVWNPNTGWRTTGLSGGWYDGPGIGIFCLRLDSSSFVSSNTVGSRLVYIPDADESTRSLQQLDADLTTLEDKVSGISKDNADNLTITSDGNVNVEGDNFYLTIDGESRMTLKAYIQGVTNGTI